MTEHWNGVAWSIVSSPGPGDVANILFDVDKLSANDVWAVGYSVTTGEVDPPLILHWDGNQWAVSPTPTFTEPAYEFILYSVEAIAPDDVWAVGRYTGKSAVYGLIMHWDGLEWSFVSSPSAGFETVYWGISAAAPDDIWIVGNYHNGQSSHKLSEHWDGQQWTIVPVPEKNYNSVLYSVKAIAPNDVWAVGEASHGIDPVIGTLVEHWDGNQWTTIPSPNPVDYFNSLNDLVALGSNDIWAVGSLRNDVGTQSPLIMHWNGFEWSVANGPAPGNESLLQAVDAVPGSGPRGELWAVGSQAEAGEADQTLIERYVDPCLPPTPTATPTLAPPRCPGERFTDVCPTDYFYTPVLALNDAGIIYGYDTVPPCDNSLHIPCFKPYNNSTRGQVAKIVSLAAGFQEPVSEQTFEDIPPGHTFYAYIERLADRAIISGYPCGQQGEPCNPPSNRPYFRPGNVVSRGQLSKIISGAFNFTEPVSGQMFEDVLPASTFYEYIQRLVARAIINGYPCGGPGEPCGVGNKPYFRPANSAARGQTAKIVYLAATQPTTTPTVSPATPTSTAMPTAPTTTPTVPQKPSLRERRP